MGTWIALSCWGALRRCPDGRRAPAGNWARDASSGSGALLGCGLCLYKEKKVWVGLEMMVGVDRGNKVRFQDSGFQTLFKYKV